MWLKRRRCLLKKSSLSSQEATKPSLTRKRTATRHKTNKQTVRYNPNHMNLLHDVDPGTKSEMNVIVEIPKGSMNKYEIDKKTGLIALDRVSHTTQAFPVDYGFVPQTSWDDGDALDVVLLTSYPLAPGILVRA